MVTELFNDNLENIIHGFKALEPEIKLLIGIGVAYAASLIGLGIYHHKATKKTKSAFSDASRTIHRNLYEVLEKLEKETAEENYQSRS